MERDEDFFLFMFPLNRRARDIALFATALARERILLAREPILLCATMARKFISLCAAFALERIFLSAAKA